MVFVSPKAAAPKSESRDDKFEEYWLRIDLPKEHHGPAHTGKEIEEDIVAELAARHGAWINSGKA